MFSCLGEFLLNFRFLRVSYSSAIRKNAYYFGC